jgi:hypothetical protein
LADPVVILMRAAVGFSLLANPETPERPEHFTPGVEMTRLELVRLSVLSSIGGDAWYGDSIEDAISDVNSREAAFRICPDTHTISEIVLHSAGWIEEIASRLLGAEPQLPAEGDWPQVGTSSEAGWERAKANLARAKSNMLLGLEHVSEGQLATMVGGMRNAALGTGVRLDEMLLGLAQHNAYHVGQVMIVKRAIRSLPRES